LGGVIYFKQGRGLSIFHHYPPPAQRPTKQAKIEALKTFNKFKKLATL